MIEYNRLIRFISSGGQPDAADIDTAVCERDDVAEDRNGDWGEYGGFGTHGAFKIFWEGNKTCSVCSSWHDIIVLCKESEVESAYP